MIRHLNMGSNLKTEEVFESAVSIVRNLPKEGPIRPSDELKLKLYAYYKQATHGPNDTPKPRFYQIVEAYKWDAWHKLGNMSREDAMLNYIKELKQVMDTIPRDQADLEDSKRFEDVLGKKFYDYWFNQWQQQSQNRELGSDPDSIMGRESDERIPANVTKSNSSSGSSLSMLEDTQSACGDGYKTPSSLAQTISGQMSDQFALAVLRLQHGLDETVARLNRVENQLQQSMESIRLLENQTFVKQPMFGGHNHKNLSNSRSSSTRNCLLVRNLWTLLSQMKSVHWFYLSYPFMVYFIMKGLDRRPRRSSR